MDEREQGNQEVLQGDQAPTGKSLIYLSVPKSVGAGHLLVIGVRQ